MQWKWKYFHFHPAIGIDSSEGFIYHAVVVPVWVGFKAFVGESKMKKLIVMLTLCSFLFVQNACSIYKASTQPPPADLQGLGIGTPRQEVILRLGAPKFSDTDAQGKKQDIFEFQSGFHSASKARILLYLAGDVVTLGLAEIIFWPLEMTVMERAICNGYATYDQSQKVDTWKVSQKDGVQGC